MTAADAITTYSPVAQTDKRVPLRLSPDEWIWPAVFMLGMTMVGLCFPLGYVVVLVAMLRSFHKSRYDFVIMLTIYAGGYSLALTEETFMTRGVVLLISIVAIFNIEKSAVVKRVLWGMLILFLIFSFFALRGVVGYFSQISPMLNRLSMIWFVVPLWAFRNQEFEIKEFFRRTVPYSMIVCIYYFLDAAVMGDQFFLPRDPMYSQEFKPTFYNLRLHMFSFAFARRWQPALYLLILSLYPAMRYYKLPVWMWAAVLVAMYIVRTFSVIMGFLVAALSLSRRRGQILKYIIIAAVRYCTSSMMLSAPPTSRGRPLCVSNRRLTR